MCIPSPFSPERTDFHGFTVFLVIGTSFFWVVVVPLHHWMLLYYLSACFEHNDWHHWIPLMVLVGALLALAMATCATRFNTVALCFAAFVCFWYWECVRACPAWSLRICLTSRELSAKDGEGGPLGTLADIASSVHGVLVRLGDGGVLGVLSDSVEPSLLEELPLVSLEAVSVISSVPVVDEEPGLLSDVPLVLAALLSVDGPVSGTLS